MHANAGNGKYFHIYEVPKSPPGNASHRYFYIYLGQERSPKNTPFGSLGQLAAVKKAPSFAGELLKEAQTRFVGYIIYKIENGVATSNNYNPKQAASDGAGLGSYLDLCISHYAGKTGVTHMRTSDVPGPARIHQMGKAGLPLRHKIPLRRYELGIAERVREKVNRFLGRQMQDGKLEALLQKQ